MRRKLREGPYRIANKWWEPIINGLSSDSVGKIQAGDRPVETLEHDDSETPPVTGVRVPMASNHLRTH